MVRVKKVEKVLHIASAPVDLFVAEPANVSTDLHGSGLPFAQVQDLAPREDMEAACNTLSALLQRDVVAEDVVTMVRDGRIFLTSRGLTIGIDSLSVIPPLLAERSAPNVPRPCDSPPPNACFLLFLLLGEKSKRDAVLGDLDEGFNEVLDRFSARRARFWYWKRTIDSVWPLMGPAITRLGRRAFGGSFLVGVGRMLWSDGARDWISAVIHRIAP
jgi:hypothetical protein